MEACVGAHHLSRNRRHPPKGEQFQ
jgi:hypothetical protein